MPFTDVKIRNLKPKAQRYDIWEDGRTGLGVRVSPSGRKVFQYMYWKDGKARRLTLGRYGAITLADANINCKEAKKAIEEGRDPGTEVVAQRRADREAETVTELAEDYLAKWARPRKRSAAEDERILKHDVIPALGARKAKAIRRKDVIAMLDRIVERGAPIQANRTLAVVRRMFNWAVRRDLLDASPCVQIEAPAPENKRDRALSDEEIAKFWNGLGVARMSEGVRLALKFILITAQRRSEVVKADWEEFDLSKGVWTIPAHRAKNNELHTVPLSKLALRLLDEIEANSADPRFLFSSRVSDGAITPNALSHALHKNLKLIGVKNLTVHDLRRTAATQMAALGIDRTVLSRVLNHVDSSITGRYDAHSYIEEKRAALERWSRRLEEIIAGEPTPRKVVDLAAHQRMT